MILYIIKEKKLKKIEKKKIITELYELKARVPTEDDIKKNIKEAEEEIKEYFKKEGVEEGIKKIKKEISKIDYKIPLYDEYTKNLYIINRGNVYNRVIYNYYRFPDKEMEKKLKEKLEKMKVKTKDIKEEEIEKNLSEIEKTEREHYIKAKTNKLLLREKRKLELMIEFLSNYDLEILKKTYIYVFYNYSNEVGKEITTCKRPAFIPHLKHIKPYYKRSEIINMGLNMRLIKPSNKYYGKEEIKKLCEQIMKNDITAETILKHQIYILNKEKIGLIQYYSLQGSYFINQYMRGKINYKEKNEILEKVIKEMWELINEAPEFDKEYILYRFIKNDDYLKELKIGDVYKSESFISTTRDPFYRSEIYKFGMILIKIKIPAKKKGVGICIEPYSHFPEEQEIILPPLSKLKLESKNKNTSYYHTDDIYESKIKTKYEFTYIGKEEIKIKEKKILENNKIIDFLKIKKKESITINEKINHFINEHLTNQYQYKTKIGKNEYDIICEWYDSTSVYEKYYAVKINNGFSMYTIKKGGVLFFIELGEDEYGSYMYVNYYFKLSSKNKIKEYTDEEFILFLSSIGYYFNINKIIIYTEYTKCEFKNMLNKNILQEENYHRTYIGGNYCLDFYNYYKYKLKKYKNIDNMDLKPQFSYYQLDRLFNISPEEILKKTDRDEIYQIYKKTYKEYVLPEKNNIAEFYIWMIENYCILTNELVKKISKLYKNNNPFDNEYYILNTFSFLYNKQLIDEYPYSIYDNEENTNYKLRLNKSLPKNNYRLEIRELQKNRKFN